MQCVTRDHHVGAVSLHECPWATSFRSPHLFSSVRPHPCSVIHLGQLYIYIILYCLEMLPTVASSKALCKFGKKFQIPLWISEAALVEIFSETHSKSTRMLHRHCSLWFAHLLCASTGKGGGGGGGDHWTPVKHIPSCPFWAFPNLPLSNFAKSSLGVLCVFSLSTLSIDKISQKAFLIRWRLAYFNIFLPHNST